MAKRGKGGSFFGRIVLPLLILGGLSLYALYLLTQKSRPKTPAETGLVSNPAAGTVLYEVPRHISLSALAHDLQSKGLIPNATVFRIFLRVSGRDKKIRAGYYYVNPSNSAMDMAWKLTSGKMATCLVTIPEGKTSWEIFSILKARFPLDSTAWDSLVHSPAFAAACQVKSPTLEGYLFPETYTLPLRISEADLIKVMVRRFREVTREFELKSPMVEKYGAHGWLTLASIVEKEAAVPAEQDLIAGVFYNRLNQGWSLGADPTVRFALRKLTGPLYVSELDNNSPYNTRKFIGLPPGPICNPGKGALKAALNPMATPMMFFVAKDDGSREHFFSIDFPGHNRFKAEAAANRQKRTPPKPVKGKGAKTQPIPAAAKQRKGA